MKMLTTLNFSKNCLAEIPLELSESKTLAELYLNDNLLCEIPAKIVSMPSLRVLEAESKFFFLNLNYLNFRIIFGSNFRMFTQISAWNHQQPFDTYSIFQ